MAFKRRRFRQIVRMRLESDKDVGMMVASEAVNGKCRLDGLLRKGGSFLRHCGHGEGLGVQ